MKHKIFAFLALLLTLAAACAGAQQRPGVGCFSPGLMRVSEKMKENPTVSADVALTVENAFYARNLSVLKKMLEGTTLRVWGDDARGGLTLERDGETLMQADVAQDGRISVDGHPLETGISVPDEAQADWNALAERLQVTPILERVPLTAVEAWLNGLKAGDVLGFGATAVNVLGLFGNKAGSRVMQVCLSHGYGMDRQERCKNSIKAVEDLLNCPEIDLYMEIPLDAIASLNDLLGGVTVTLMDDFTMTDSAMKEGATLTLTGEQAMTLVRRRIDVADGTNEARMTRQRIFMDAAIPKIRQKIDESSGFVTTMIDTLSPYLTTNMARGRMINEINRAYHYEVEPVQYLTGEHSIGEDGFMEFHADEQSIVDFVLDAFYTKQE